MPSACWLSNLSVTLPDSVLASKGHSTEPLLLLLPAAVVNVLTVKDEDLEMSEAGREVVSSDNQLVSCDRFISYFLVEMANCFHKACSHHELTANKTFPSQLRTETTHPTAARQRNTEFMSLHSFCNWQIPFDLPPTFTFNLRSNGA